MKETEANPFEGEELRHPVGSRRYAVIAGRYGGGVFCNLPDGTVCMCNYSYQHEDFDFQVDENIVIAQNPTRQLIRQRREMGLVPDAVQAPHPGEDRLELLPCEQRPVQFEALRDGHAAPVALSGDQGDARAADVLNVPVDGAPGHLEAPCQLGRGDFVLLEQNRDDPHQTVDFHSNPTTSFFNSIAYGRGKRNDGPAL